ncbi:MAG: MraY family glycosyltransferase [Candidatus Omnitrophica bacterium]|nr:MraY family glycosyltransferase [Candidatus Omnitrophota bacterium]
MSISAAFMVTAILLTVFLVIVLRGFNSLSKDGMPLAGGIAIGVALIVTSMYYWTPAWLMPSQMQGILIASGVMLLFGFVDDIKELSVVGKLIVQLAAVAILILCGVRTHIVYIGTTLNILITVIWVLGITNAINLLDVMDGLAGSVALMVSLAFCVIASINGDAANAVLACGIAASVSGFLIFNLPPARLYMGNAGSHFLGFLFASMAISIHYASLEAKLALMAPILILGFPIFDTLFLIFMRVRKGRSAFNKSNDHLALRFLKAGYSKQAALLIMVLVASVFVVSGIAMFKLPGVYVFIPPAIVVVLSIFLSKRMSRVVIDG